MITGSALNGHSLKELHAPNIIQYEVGFFGLFLDGMSGILFQAPFYLLGVFALLYWREMPASFRIGIIGSLPYIVSLVPRAEWHGGWSPPLRYIVVFMPVLFLGAAAIWQRFRPVAFLAPAALWTIGLAIHGLAFPWRLFHIESGENYAGEWLSRLYHADFSRLFPSFIRSTAAALVASIAFVVALLLFRFVRVPQVVIAPLLAIALLAGFRYGAAAGESDRARGRARGPQRWHALSRALHGRAFLSPQRVDAEGRRVDVVSRACRHLAPRICRRFAGAHRAGRPRVQASSDAAGAPQRDGLSRARDG